MIYMYGNKIPNKTVVLKITFYCFPDVDGLIKTSMVCWSSICSL